jgi:hypothetical protein
MASKEELESYIEELDSASDMRFSRLLRICEDIFGECRIKGSHHVFRVPWQGDPRINLQAEGPNAKRYQIRQVSEALRKMVDTA